ncbi:hypothetical protein [Flavobacterium sp. 3HN19-14]|uniref:hypothetical protein n=1 Tax=Flavobacterium sp. 3HN19-14 TaxID=3448133 RepID=UPI003EDF22DB
MIIRHAEKPGDYGGYTLNGINRAGQADAESLVTAGWERGGAIANLFYPTNGAFQDAALATPDTIYASDPADKSSGKEPSQRPYQTITQLYAKIGSSVNLILSFKDKDYHDMVKDALKQSGTVLISWQHQDILPEKTGDECILTHLLKETGTTPSSLPIPTASVAGFAL